MISKALADNLLHEKDSPRASSGRLRVRGRRRRRIARPGRSRGRAMRPAVRPTPTARLNTRRGRGRQHTMLLLRARATRRTDQAASDRTPRASRSTRYTPSRPHQRPEVPRPRPPGASPRGRADGRGRMRPRRPAEKKKGLSVGSSPNAEQGGCEPEDGRMSRAVEGDLMSQTSPNVADRRGCRALTKGSMPSRRPSPSPAWQARTTSAVSRRTIASIAPSMTRGTSTEMPSSGSRPLSWRSR